MALAQSVETAPQQGARALVLSGSSGIFSAGLDVPCLLKLDQPSMNTVWRNFYSLMRALACSRIPIVAAITGHAPAGGTVLAIFCDYRVAAEGDAKLGLSEVQVGLPLPPLIFSALRRLIGARQAERLGVTGALISPEEAAMVGLIDEVVASDRVVNQALRWCESVLALPPAAVQLTRKQARADLFEAFAQQKIDEELSQVSSWWWIKETQEALHEMVQRLAMKKRA